jgi:NADH-quinone oxidoreductase subunit F
MGALCGLGKTAPNPVLTTIRYFRDEYEAHVKYKKCPAVVCKEIISSACHHTCPIGQEASTYIALIAQRRYEEAFKVIVKDNPLPSVVARVCHHPCEAKCQAGKWAEPISIRGLKRFVTDYALENDLYPKKTFTAAGSSSSNGRIAIIGAGPAGLTAGHCLAAKGYDTTIFEAYDVPGGALSLYIPEYRLPRNVLNVDLEHIKTSGLRITTRTRIGKDISFKELCKSYQALFIATGAHKSRKLRIENEEAEGVLDALDVLRDINLDREVKLGGRVGIIGGGNAAIDAARCVIRKKGCETVAILYRRTRREMPAFKEEIDAAIEEGVVIQLLTAPIKIIAENGKMTGVELIKMKLGEPDTSGRRRPVPIEGSEYIAAFDTLIVAIGQDPDLSFLGKEHGLKISKEGTIDVDAETGSTNIPGVFAGGDAVTGANTVTDAMSAGKIAAEMIDKYLRGQNLSREYTLTRPSLYVAPVELTEEEIESAKRPEISCISIIERSCNYKEVDLTMGEDTAIDESRRCLRCDLETEEARKWMEQRQLVEVKNNG